MAGKTRAAAVSSILSAKDSNGESLLKTAYASSVNSDGAADEAMETAMNSIENKIAVLKQSTQTMWQDAISSDLIKFLVDVANGFVNVTDKIGLFKVALAATGIGLFIANLKDIKSGALNINNAIASLNGMLSKESVSTEQYAMAMAGLSDTQKQVVLSHLNLSNAEKQQVSADLAAKAATESLSEAKTAELLATKLGSTEKAQATIKTLAEASALEVENGVIKNVNKQKVIDTLTTQGYSAAEIKATLSTLGFSGATGVLSASLTALGATLKTVIAEIWTFLTTNPVGWIALVVAGVAGLVAVINKLNPSYEKLKENLVDTQEAYSDAKSEVEDLTSKLDELNDKIKEIQSKDKLSLTDQQDLENLQAQSKELQFQLDVAKEKERITKEQDNEAAEKLYNKTHQSDYTDYGTVLHGSAQIANNITDAQEARNQINILKEYSSKAKEAQAKVDALTKKKTENNGNLGYIDNVDLKKAQKELDSYNKVIKGTRTDANATMQSLLDMYESFDKNTESGKKARKEIEKIIGSYGLLQDELDNTTTHFDTLSEAQQRAALISKMEEQTSLAANDIRDFVDGLNKEDLSVVYGMKMDTDTSIKNLQDGLDKMQAAADDNPITVKTTATNASDVKDFLTNTKVNVDGSDKALDSIFSDYRSEIDSLGDYLSRALNNTLSNDDYTSLATEFGIVADNADDAAAKIKEVMSASKDDTIKALDTAIKEASDTMDDKMVESLTKLKKKLEEVNTEALKTSSGTSGYINSMSNMATGFDALDKIYADVKNGKGDNKSSSNNGKYFDFSSLVDSNFVDQFKDCGQAYQDFLNIVASSPADINKCQSAFDKLATEYVLQKAGIDKLVDGQGNINQSLRKTTIAQLENYGVTNAQTVVDAELQAKSIYLSESLDTLSYSTDGAKDSAYNHIEGLLDEGDATGVTCTALYDLISAEKIFNNTDLSTADKIGELEKLANAFGITADAARDAVSAEEYEKQRTSLKNAELHGAPTNILNDYSDWVLKKNSTAYQDAISAKFGNISGHYSGGQNSNKTGSSSSSSTPTTTLTKNYINWLEKAIDNIQSKINRLNNKVSDLTPYNKKIKTLKEIYSWQRKLAEAEKNDVAVTKKRYEDSLKNIPAKVRKYYKNLIESTATKGNYEQYTSTSTSGKKGTTQSSTKTTGTVGSAAYNEALKYLGTPYVYGGTSLTNGIDCSGLTQQIYKKYGINLPHHAASQAKMGTKVTSKSNLQAGDLVFFGKGGKVTHVGIYGGDDKFIEAPNSKSKVRVSTLSNRKDYLYGTRLSGTTKSATYAATSNKLVDKENKTLYDSVNNSSQLYSDYLKQLETAAKQDEETFQALLNVYDAEIDHLNNRVDLCEARISRSQAMIDSGSVSKVDSDIPTIKDAVKKNLSISDKDLKGNSKKAKNARKLDAETSKIIKEYADKYGMKPADLVKLARPYNNNTDGIAADLLASYNKKQYDIQIAQYKKEAESQKGIAAKRRAAMKDLENAHLTTSEEYVKLANEAVKADEAAIEAAQNTQEAYKNKYLSDYNAKVSVAEDRRKKNENVINGTQAKIDFNSNNGITTDKEDYQSVLDSSVSNSNISKVLYEESVKQRDRLQKQLAKVDPKKDADKYNALVDSIKDLNEQVAENEQAWYDDQQAVKDAQEQMLKAPLTGLQKQLDLINAQIDALDKLKSKYSDAISVVTWYLDEQISSLNQQKENMEKYYDSLIDPLQENLDALQRTNDQRERALALEKAQYQLQKALDNKSNKVLRNGEWVKCMPLFIVM